MTTDNIIIKALQGKELKEHLAALAALRIEVFRSFPYLYEGTLSYEMDYLEKYVKAERASVFCAFHEDRMIGATTCLPLVEEAQEVKEPFSNFLIPMDQIFYFGESILLLPYRGRGLGHRFFDYREQHVKQYGTYKLVCFCSVIRPANHPEKPSDYRSNNEFWIKRGYTKRNDLVCQMKWPDIGEVEETNKSLEFWLKSL